MFKDIITKILEKQTRRYLAKHTPKLIAVAGSVGKTSTKVAIATVLARRDKVRLQEGNYNVDVTVPLVIFGIQLPANIRNPFAWLGVLSRTEMHIHKKDAGVDVIVVELGTDKPGDISAFGTYLRPDISIVTAVSAEHMEFFKTMEAVAAEELSIAEFSKLTIINRDDVDEIFAKLAHTSNIDTYGLSGLAEYRFIVEDDVEGIGFNGKFVSPEFGEVDMHLQVLGEHNIKAAVAAGAVGAKLGMTSAQIKQGMEAIQPVPGRMNLLRGVQDSKIIDDTYNSSPLAAIAALQTLYLMPAPQRIAILGNMNELGEFSPQAHEQVGKSCESNVLDWVITIGDDAEKYLAPAAASKGCQVRSFKTPHEAGAFAHKVMQPEAVILVKGSQNGVYAEEAIKILLHSTDDEEKLVRQSDYWLKKKNEQFSAFK
jgi:UDP-N-acetylmuramoyl-tripeptide--D-alanyl-D-alanine ligase